MPVERLVLFRGRFARSNEPCVSLLADNGESWLKVCTSKFFKEV